MKFYELIKENIKQNEVLEVLNDPNFQIGLEFEFVYAPYKNGEEKFVNFKLDPLYLSNNLDEVEDIEERFFKPFYVRNVKRYLEKNGISSKGWVIGYDGSIDIDNKINDHFELQAEVATPILNIKEAFKVMNIFFKYIDRVGYTNSSCSMHVNISHKKINLNDINKNALALSLEEPHIYKYMPERENTGYAKSTQKAFLDTKGEYLYTGKYWSLNPQKDRFEFRAIGGTDYQKKSSIMIELILNMIIKFKKSSEPNFMDKKLNLLKYKGSYAYSSSPFNKLELAILNYDFNSIVNIMSTYSIGEEGYSEEIKPDQLEELIYNARKQGADKISKYLTKKLKQYYNKQGY